MHLRAFLKKALVSEKRQIPELQIKGSGRPAQLLLFVHWKV